MFMAKKKGPHWGAILLDDTPEMMGHIAGIFTEVARCMHCDVDTVRQGILNLYRRGMTSEKPQKRSAWAPLHGSGEEPTPEEILLFSVDGRLFIQVLVNLLDNAFRHSGEGTTVTISAERVGNNIRFQVSDDGVGIPEGKMAQIFDNFFTTAYQHGDRQRGVGLGLTICKAIVEAQGGTISAFNNSAGGATFSVEMPMEDMKGE